MCIGISIFESDSVEIMNPGVLMANSFNPDKEDIVFKLKIPSGEIKTYKLPSKVKTSFIREWGDDTDKWVGKTAIVTIGEVKNPMTGAMKDKVFLSPEV